jgi:hypothetical protein
MSTGRLALEALAIFAGVTAGFLAEDYRESRNERRQEREALEQIARDLEIDAADITPIVETSRVVAEAMKWLHNNVRRRDVPRDSVILILDGTPWVYSYEAANAAYTGLKAAGQLRLIRDIDVRRDIVFYFEDRQAAMEQLNEWILADDLTFWNLMAPHVVYAETDSFLGQRPAIETLDVEAMQGDRRLASQFTMAGGSAESQAVDGAEILRLNRRLVESIRVHLGNE